MSLRNSSNNSAKGVFIAFTLVKKQVVRVVRDEAAPWHIHLLAFLSINVFIDRKTDRARINNSLPNPLTVHFNKHNDFHHK